MGDNGRDRFPTKSDKQLKQKLYALLPQDARLSWLLKIPDTGSVVKMLSRNIN